MRYGTPEFTDVVYKSHRCVSLAQGSSSKFPSIQLISALFISVSLPTSVLFHPTLVVLAIPGSTPIGCNGIPVPPEDPPLGTLHRNSVSSKITMAHALFIGRSERQAAGAGKGYNIIPIPAADQSQWDWLPLLPCFCWCLKYERAGRSSFPETVWRHF